MDTASPAPPPRPRHPRAAKRTAAQRAADLDFVAASLVRGRTIREIAAAISAVRPYSLSASQVGVDAKAAQERWKLTAQASIATAQARTLATLDALERQAWEGWEQSRGPLIRITETAPKDDAGASRITATKETRPAGDAAFLRVLLEVSERRARLLGFEGSQTTDTPPTLTVIVNPPPDARPWHERVYAATGRLIPPATE
jgi:hypothetical protein